MYRSLFIFILLSCFLTCQRKHTTLFVRTIKPIVSDTQTQAKRGNPPNNCADKMNYIPDAAHPDHFPMRYLRVNFHIMRKGDGQGHFNEKEGVAYVQDMMKLAEGKLNSNNPMNLPPGNNIPAPLTKYRYLLTPDPARSNDDGIYFHNDDELYYMLRSGRHKNIFDRKVYDKYGIQKDTVMNIFIMADHADSLASKTYKSHWYGVGMGAFNKVTSGYSRMKKARARNDISRLNYHRYAACNNLNHEIGHSLGLQHTWRGNDGCEDTPNNPNCWNEKDPNKSNCGTLASNNVMDYNTYNNAWSPCQVGSVHQKFSYIGKSSASTRKYLLPVWCEFNPERSITITDKIIWNGARDLEGNIEIKAGGELTIRCRVSMPPGGKIKVFPGGRLILDGGILENACGKKWLGIELVDETNPDLAVVAIGTPVIKDVVNEVIVE
ncbi:MAG: M43 family zinc metalloprotease [Saprospiraceae bacterium]